MCICKQDGRLRSGDLLLQIGHVDVSSMSIEEVAQELRFAGTKVKLLIATADGDLSSPIARQQDTQVRKRQVQGFCSSVCASVIIHFAYSL